MAFEDDDLTNFEAHGAAPLPAATDQGYVEHVGARIWYGTYGSGSPVVLLHGGLGHSGNWGYQARGARRYGYRAILVDSRGHGRSSRDERPFSYELMAGDVLAVMDALRLEQAALVGWSDGACTALILAAQFPSRVAGVCFFACNMDPSGVKKFQVNRSFEPLFRSSPEGLCGFVGYAGGLRPLRRRCQPNATDATQLLGAGSSQIRVPVVIVQSEHDEFIKREHAEYLAKTIPKAELIILSDVTHFAPLQRPELFNAAILRFVGAVRRKEADGSVN